MIQQKSKSLIVKIAVTASAFLTIWLLMLIVCYVLIKGIPNISLDLFSATYTSENASLIPALINTVIITLLTLLIAVPFGVSAAIYLVEYAKTHRKSIKIIRITTETLAGIPSIVYALFGNLFFVTMLNLKLSIISGALTLAIMVLPVIIRTTEEALISVPNYYREASFGLGAGKFRTITKVVLPSAINGIMSGIVLSIGRIVGETAALIFTAGTVAQIGGLFNSGRTLSVHLYALWNEGLSIDKAYATAVIILIIVIILNYVSSYIAKKLSFRNGK